MDDIGKAYILNEDNYLMKYCQYLNRLLAMQDVANAMKEKLRKKFAGQRVEVCNMCRIDCTSDNEIKYEPIGVNGQFQ
ncbi:hypothetical protein M0R01_03985 [bacterium]|nr:hypothetical protein [bacterium]